MCIVVFFGLLAIGLAVYYTQNKGVPHNARGQQTRRLIFTTLLAAVPATVMGLNIMSMPVMLAAAVALLWMVTFPTLFNITNRRVMNDYENYMDIVMGIYLFGIFAGLLAIRGVAGAELTGNEMANATASTEGFANIFGAAARPFDVVLAIVVSIAEILALVIPVFLWVYYFLYGGVVDDNGMKLIEDTDVNEVLEFSRSFGKGKQAAVIIAIIATAALIFAANMMPVSCGAAGFFPLAIAVIALVIIIIYVFKRHHGVFTRTSTYTLYNDVKEFRRRNSEYVASCQKRLSSLQITANGEPYSKPSTIIMIIGESASRDYMSCFRPQAEGRETTPWMTEMAADEAHWTLFKHAYSCAMHTVPVLEKALTEYNQYNDKTFNDSCSIVDIAHKMGYTVHWYSNQGHVGVNDTPISLVAETSDVAKWTAQEVNKTLNDEALLDFLDEVDPTKNNLVVMHLIGSHFNYLNRYPAEQTVWGEKNVEDNLLNYLNSLHYTDLVLKKIYEYGRTKLNLQAMVYFSDHAENPTLRRSPRFNGFGMVRIPMAIYTSDEFIAKHRERHEAIKGNQDKYFTNDLIYDLMCGIFDIESNRFDPTNSLAYSSYRFTRDDLLTAEGKQRIADDKGE